MFEVSDLIESHNKVRRQMAKENICQAFAQAEQIVSCLSIAMSGEGQMLQPWDYFPDLFKDEREEFEQEQTNAEKLEEYKARRKKYVDEFNRRRRQ